MKRTRIPNPRKVSGPLNPNPITFFSGCGMQNHTIQPHGNSSSYMLKELRQRRANEHADDTERRLSAERETRQQMRANESLEGRDKRLENQREQRRRRLDSESLKERERAGSRIKEDNEEEGWTMKGWKRKT